MNRDRTRGASALVFTVVKSPGSTKPWIIHVVKFFPLLPPLVRQKSRNFLIGAFFSLGFFQFFKILVGVYIFISSLLFFEEGNRRFEEILPCNKRPHR
jgi:hypothetical protein